MRIFKSIIFYSIFIFFNFVNADLTIDSESNAPVLNNFTATPNYVDVTDGPVVVTLSIDIEEESDSLTVYRPSIISCNGNGGGPPPSSAWQLVSGDINEGTWEVDITIPETQGEDKFYLYSNIIEDKWGNRSTATSSNSNDPDCGAESGGVDITNDNAETDVPVLSNFTATPNYVDVTDGPVVVTLSIDIEEDSGSLTVYRPSIISCNGNGGGPSPSSAWQLVSGDAYDGTWEVDITIPETQGEDKFYLYSNIIEDKWGNRSTATSSNYTDPDCGAESGGVDITNDNAETDAPVLSNFTATPNYVDVTNGSEIVTLSIDIEEESGSLTVYRPSIISCNGNGGGPPPSSAWQLVSGDTYDGTWEVDITIPETQGDDQFYLYSSYIEDKWGNRSTATSSNYTDPDCGAESGGINVVNNHPPKIKSSSFDVDENTTNIGKLRVTDKDGDSLTYAITGNNNISINSNTGKLTFKRAPDFESKSQYTFKAYVNDGTVTTTKRITVNIKDVNEPPSLLTTRFIINQGETRRVSLQATDPESDAVTFQLSPGGDAAYFSLNKSSGVLSFIEKPNFDEKTEFNISIELNDGELTASNNAKLILRTEYFTQMGETITNPINNNGGIFGGQIASTHDGNKIFVSGTFGNQYEGLIREYDFVNGNWINSNNFGEKGGYLYRKLGYGKIEINKNANKIFYLECLTDGRQGGYACQLPDGSNGVELNFKKFNSITERWERNGSPIELKTQYHFIGIDNNGRYLSLREDDVISSSSNYPECVDIKIQRYKQKRNDDWRKFKKPFSKNKVDILNGETDMQFSKTGERVLFFNELRCINQGGVITPEAIRDNSIEVFEYYENSWRRVGNKIKLDDIFGDNINLKSSNAPRIKINNDLTKIALAYASKDLTDNYISHIFIYSFNASRGKWVREKNFIETSGIDTGYDLFDISDDFKTIITKEKGFQFQEACPHPPMIIYKYKDRRWKKFGYNIVDDYIHDCDDWGQRVFGKNAQNALSGDGKRFILHNFYPETESGKYGFAKIFKIKGD